MDCNILIRSHYIKIYKNTKEAITLPFLHECVMKTTEFNKPKVLMDRDAIYTLLIRLALLEPGTNQQHPEMGLGLRSKYRNSFASNLANLISDYKKQIETYLPEYKLADIKGSVKDHTLFLEVSIDDMVYPIYVDTEKYTLANL